MTPKEAAERLDGGQYGQEGSRELWSQMKDSGLVAVYGGSDDLMEFEGAIYDEIGCYGGGSVKVTPKGLLDPDDDIYSRAEKEAFPTIKALWCPDDRISWAYETSIPHEQFEIWEDGEIYCRGIVFALADVVTQ